MPLETLNFDVYEKYRDTIIRYMQLVPSKHEDKVITATVHIMYAIQDINRQIEKYNSGELDISIYYQMMVKTDFLISFVEALYNIFIPELKRKAIWADDYLAIRKFRLYRSLTLAHPLETTRYEDLGFGNDNNKWCEDVHVKGKTESMFHEELTDADFIMGVMEKDKCFPTKTPISVREDIISVVLIALRHLDVFTVEISLKTVSVVDDLRNMELPINKAMDMTEYINKLLIEVKKRYPNEIEDITYEDGTTAQFSVLLDASERLKYSFQDMEREKKYLPYKEEIRQAVYDYAESIQNMSLENTDAHGQLLGLLYPDSSILSDKSTADQAHYRHEKITSYLSNSIMRSIESAREKLEMFSYDGCRGIGICTHAEWGVIQLLTLQNEFIPYFSIDFDASDKELFIQYCTALYYANKSAVDKLP
jgi:hypothetical protein